MPSKTHCTSSRRTTTAILVGLAAMTLPMSASAQTITAKKYADVGGWTIEAYSADGGHMNCGAVVPGSTAAAKLSFERSSEGLTVVVPIKAKAKAGDEVNGAVEIDGKSTRGKLHVRDDGRAMAFLKAPQIKSLRTAKSMTVTVGAEKTPIPLAGIDAALRKANECNEKGGA
jgi:hypothetical protein